MKSEWQTRKLGDLLEVQNGYAFSSKDYSESGHFIMRIGNVQNGYVALSNPKFINLTADEKLQRFVLSEGDILVSLTGNVGRVGVIQKEHLPAALNQRVARITINKDSPATREFLLFFLYSDWFREELIGAGHGAAQQNVSTKDLVEIQLPFPPLPEQKRIVGILDKAFAAISTAKENAEKNLQNARELFESYLQSVFANPGDGWEEKKLGKIGKAIYGYTEKASFNKIGPKFLRITDIQDGRVNWGTVPFCKINKTDLEKYILTDGDIVFARTGATTGKSFLVRNPPQSVFASYLIKVHITNKELIPEYLFLFFQTKIYWDVINAGVSGSAQGGFNATKLSELSTPIPPLPEQKHIVAKLDSLSAETKKLEAIYQQKISDLEELKKSILQKAFNGELAEVQS